MNCLEGLCGAYVTVILSGDKNITGYLKETGPDLLVVLQQDRLYYIPLGHVQNISQGELDYGNDIEKEVETTNHPFQMDGQQCSLRKVLIAARGHFLEIYISGNTAIHGYLTSVMNDYFVFHSPVYKTISVSLHHLKWLVPYHDDVTPYALNPDTIPHRSVPTSLPRSFSEQCKRLTGSLVVFDMGEHPSKIGRLNSVDADLKMVELLTADGTPCFVNLQHLKTVYVP